MSKCNFSLDFSGNAGQLVSSANQAIAASGGIFSGDDTAGHFSIITPLGKIAGSYTVEGQTFRIAVSEKPFLLSCSRIEDELRKQLT